MARKHLKMHRQLLLDVIRRQAGTLHKAVLEGVMNAIEAGAIRVDIGFNVDENGVARMSITDNGKGIPTLEDIENFFETFGTPHDESEGKRWAQFRMGRGQMFSFGKNTWRTGPFKMFVDVEGLGLSYDLEEGLEHHDGCRIDIELYKNPLKDYSYTSLDSLRDNIQEQVEFMDTPIYFNGKRLNRDVSKIDWTDEDEYAYYLFGVGTDLTVYNLGAFVCKKSAYHEGVDGIVLSKQQLKVNFARNDIQHDCAVYEHIKKVIASHRRKKVTNRKSALDDSERIAIMRDARDGGLDLDEHKSVALVRTAIGRALSLDAIKRSRLPWSFAPKDDHKADRLMQSEKAIVFDESLLSEMRHHGDPSEFFTALVKNHIESKYDGRWRDYKNSTEWKKWKSVEALYVPFDQLANRLKDRHDILPDSQLTAKEKYILRTLENEYEWGRRLCFGLSDTARAWTDGESFIAIDRKWHDGLRYWHTGAAQLVNVLTHELAHDEDTSGSHVHGEEFYRRFHDLCVRNENPPQSILERFQDKVNNSKLVKRCEEEQRRAARKEAKKQQALAASSK